MDFDAVVARIEELKLRLPTLEGKANKRERTAVSKEIYALENSPAFVEAEKARLDTERSAVATAEAEAGKVAALAEQEVAAAAATAALEKRRQQPESAVAILHFRRQVETLFDEYAPDFEDALVNGLGYRMPQELERTLREGASDGDAPLSTLCCADLGCGTGLAGLYLKPHCTSAAAFTSWLGEGDLSSDSMRQVRADWSAATSHSGCSM